jgi:hypothetical protein
MFSDLKTKRKGEAALGVDRNKESAERIERKEERKERSKKEGDAVEEEKKREAVRWWLGRAASGRTEGTGEEEWVRWRLNWG